MYRAGFSRGQVLPPATDTGATISSISSIEHHSRQRQSAGALRSHDARVGRRFCDPTSDQELLLYAAKSNENSGVRLGSVDALVAKSGEPAVQEALTYALRYDSNPGVRLRAMDGLSPYVKPVAIPVRNAVIEALLNDSVAFAWARFTHWSRFEPTAVCGWRCRNWPRTIPTNTFATSRRACWPRHRIFISN